MNDASDYMMSEKQAECQRICGESGKRGVHTIAPEMCPIKKDEWLKGTKVKHG